MRKLLAFAMAGLFTFAANAQVNVSGTITNQETNEPITGAHIYVEGTYIGVYSKNDGTFELLNVKKPLPFTLIVSHLSFDDASITATDADGLNSLEIQLTERSVLADEVIVSATRADRNVPTTYNEVDKETIEKQNLGQDIPFLLDQTPSVVINSDAGAGVGYTSMRIRGSDLSQINVTVNGIPYNDAESQGVFFVDLPDFASSVESIQIQRGVGTSSNGSGAFGATVNIQTTALNKDPYGEIGISYGSFNTLKTTAKFGTGLMGGKFSVDGRLSRISSDGFVDRATAKLRSFFISTGYHGKKTLLKLNAFSGHERTYQSWYGTPEDSLETNRSYNFYNYEDEVDDYRQDHYQAILSQQIGDKVVLNTALHLTRGLGFFEQYKGLEYNNDDGFNGPVGFNSIGLNNLVIGNDTITETALVRRRWLDNYFYGVTASVIYEVNKKSQLTVGGAWNQYRGDHYGEVIWAEYGVNVPKDHRYYDNEGLKNDLSMYTKFNYRFFNKLNVFLDIQYRNVLYQAEGVDNDQRVLDEDHTLHFINPKAGLSYDVNKNHQVYASFAVGNREPTRADFIDAPAGSTPKHETLYNLETGYQFSTTYFALMANYYLMYYHNQLVLTGDVNDVGSPIRVNVDKSYRTGIELQGQLKLFKKLTWDVNFTYSINQIKNFNEVLTVYDENFNFVETAIIKYGNTDISFSPNIIAGSVLSYEPVKGLTLAFISKYVGKQYLDNTGSDDRKIDAYFTSNFRVNYVVKKWGVKEIGLHVLVNNIFNAEYETNGYTFGWEIESADNRTRQNYNYYYPQAGINVLGGITLKF